jgi:putative transposase
MWCGEDGWCYFTAVIDCYDRSILGWVFTRRCRTIDVIDAAAKAHACAWPHGIDTDDVTVVLRHDNGSQFTSTRFLDDCKLLGITTSRTAYRHPDGNAFIERLYKAPHRRSPRRRARRTQNRGLNVKQPRGHYAFDQGGSGL